MADKPYINLDDDLIDDYSADTAMTPPTPPTTPEGDVSQDSFSADPLETPNYAAPLDEVKITGSAHVNSEGGVSDLSVALEQEMQDIEKQMYAVAVDGFNRKREQAHQDIDKLYDEMIAVAEDKLRGITVAIAEEVGE